jgi:hypothetical protein
METILTDEIKSGSSTVIEGFIAVRPSFMTRGPAVGMKGIRSEMYIAGKIDKSAIGYTIAQEDVGGWMYAELLENQGAKRREYLNQFVSLTS